MTRLRATRYEAILDLLAEALAVEDGNAFPEPVLAMMRRAIPCDAVSYYEWDCQQALASSLAAEEPEKWLAVWEA